MTPGVVVAAAAITVRVTAASKFDLNERGRGPGAGVDEPVSIGPVKPLWSSPRQTKMGSRP